MNQEPTQSYDVTLFTDIVRDIYRDLVRETNAEIQDALVVAIFKLRTTPRWYLISTDEALDEIWSTIRDDGPLLDFVLGGTSRFLLRATHNETHYTRMINHCAKSIGWVMDSSIIDTAITDRSASSEWYVEVFKSAPWVLFVYLLSIAPQVE